MRRYSTSLAIREMKTKTAKRHHYTLIRMIKTLTIYTDNIKG